MSTTNTNQLRTKLSNSIAGSHYVQIAEAILSKSVVAAILGVSETTLDAWMHDADTDFPAAVLMGEVRSTGRPSRVGWLKSEIEEFIRRRAQTRVVYSSGRARVVHLEERNEQ